MNSMLLTLGIVVNILPYYSFPKQWPKLMLLLCKDTHAMFKKNKLVWKEANIRNFRKLVTSLYEKYSAFDYKNKKIWMWLNYLYPKHHIFLREVRDIQIPNLNRLKVHFLYVEDKILVEINNLLMNCFPDSVKNLEL